MLKFFRQKLTREFLRCLLPASGHRVLQNYPDHRILQNFRWRCSIFRRRFLSCKSPEGRNRVLQRHLKPQDGWQVAAGYYYQTHNAMYEINVEAYYKQMNNYLTYRSAGRLLPWDPCLSSRPAFLADHHRSLGSYAVHSHGPCGLQYVL